MALGTRINCGPLRRTAIVGLNQVIETKLHILYIARTCRLLQGGKKLISSQVHSTGLCHLSALAVV